MKNAKRETTKRVLQLYASVLALAVSLLFVVTGVVNVYEESYYSSYDYTVSEVQEDLDRGYIQSAQIELEHNDYYGEDFEYAWEHILIYHLYDRYRIMELGLAGAVERGADPEHIAKVTVARKAYRDDLEEILMASTEEKNEYLVAYYRMLLGEE